MTAQHAGRWSRREVLAGLTLAGTAGLLSWARETPSDSMNFGESSSIVRDIPSSCLLKPRSLPVLKRPFLLTMTAMGERISRFTTLNPPSGTSCSAAPGSSGPPSSAGPL
jgi:hypothetical protein